MAEKDTEGLDEKSLELPSLFGRKKKRGSKGTPASADAATDPPQSASAAAPAPAPASGSTTDDATVVTEPVRDTVAASDHLDDTVVTEPARDPGPAPAAPAAPVAPLEPAPAARTAEPARAAGPTPEPADEPTRTIPSVTAPVAGARTEPDPAAASTTTTDQPAPGGGARKAKPARSMPSLGAAVAALVVGALVGLLGVGLTWGSLQACDALTGTDSCGGPGLLVVLLVVVVMIVVGSALLRGFGVTEPGGLSFLGVAIFVAICLVFLLEHLLDPWMVVVGPALCALGYGTAHWVVNRFDTELLVEDGPEAHDIR